MVNIVRHCINAVVVILLVSILFKVNIVINAVNLGKLVLMGIICSWFDSEVFK